MSKTIDFGKFLNAENKELLKKIHLARSTFEQNVKENQRETNQLKLLKESLESLNTNCSIMDNYRLMTENSLQYKSAELKATNCSIERIELDINKEKELERELNDRREIEHERIEDLKQSLQCMNFTLNMQQSHNDELEKCFKDKYNNIVYYQSQKKEDDGEMRKIGVTLEKLEVNLKIVTDDYMEKKRANNTLRAKLESLKKNLKSSHQIHTSQMKELQNCMALIDDQERKIFTVQHQLQITLQKSYQVFQSNQLLKEELERKKLEKRVTMQKRRTLDLQLDRCKSKVAKSEETIRLMEQKLRSLAVQFLLIDNSGESLRENIDENVKRKDKVEKRCRNLQSRTEAIKMEILQLEKCETLTECEISNLENLLKENLNVEQKLMAKLNETQKQMEISSECKQDLKVSIERISIEIRNQKTRHSSCGKQMQQLKEIKNQKLKLIYKQQYQINHLESRVNYLKGNLDTSQMQALIAKNTKQKEALQTMRKDNKEVTNLIAHAASQHQSMQIENQTLQKRSNEVQESILECEISIKIMTKRLEERDREIRACIYQQSRVKLEIKKSIEKQQMHGERFETKKENSLDLSRKYEKDIKANNARLILLAEMQRQYENEKRNLSLKRSEHSKKLDILMSKYRNLQIELTGSTGESNLSNSDIVDDLYSLNSINNINDQNAQIDRSDNLLNNPDFSCDESKLYVKILFEHHEKIDSLRKTCNKLRQSNAKLSKDLQILTSTHSAMLAVEICENSSCDLPTNQSEYSMMKQRNIAAASIGKAERQNRILEVLRSQKKQFAVKLNEANIQLRKIKSEIEDVSSKIVSFDSNSETIEQDMFLVTQDLEKLRQSDQQSNKSFIRLRKQINRLIKEVKTTNDPKEVDKLSRSNKEDAPLNDRYSKFIDAKLLALETSKLCSLLKSLNERMTRSAKRDSSENFNNQQFTGNFASEENYAVPIAHGE